MGFGVVNRNSRLASGNNTDVLIPADAALAADVIVVANTASVLSDSAVGSDNLIINTANNLVVADAIAHGVDAIVMQGTGFTVDAGHSVENVSVQIAGGGPSNLTLAWDALAGADSYTLEYGVNTREYTTTVTGIAQTSISLNLTIGLTYWFVISGVKAGVKGFRSKEVSTVIPNPARKFYVSNSGSDSNPGTINSPWATLQHAVTAMAAGDHTFVRGGTYTVPGTNAGPGNLSGLSFWTKNGTPTAKIVLRGMPGENVIVNGSNVGGQYNQMLIFANCSYCRIENMHLTLSGYRGVMFWGESHHCECESILSDLNGTSGFWFEQTPSTKSFHVVNNCQSYNNEGGSDGGITVWISGADGSNLGGYVLIQGCLVHDQANGSSNFDAMQIGGNSGGVHHFAIIDNEVYNSGGDAAGPDSLDLGGHGIAHHYLVERNWIHDGSSSGAFKCHSGYKYFIAPTGSTYIDGLSSHMIVRFNRFTGVLHHECYGFPNPIGMYNNTWYNMGRFFFYFNQDRPVHNPTSLGDTSYATWLGITGKADTDTGRLKWKNNIFFNSTAGGVALEWNQNGGTMLVSYDSVRGQNNMWKLAAGGSWTWGSGGSFTTLAAWQASQPVSAKPETGSVQLPAATGPTSVFNDPVNSDWQLIATSPAVVGNFTAAPHSFAIGAGTGSITLTADCASMFHDGYYDPVSGSRVTAADWIQIGNGAPVQIFQIPTNVTNPAQFNVITLAQARTWADGDPIWLCDEETRTPMKDAGAFQWQGAVRMSRVLNLKVTSI